MTWRWKGLRVLQISPQRWDDIKLSKHHYAAEMAARGAEVYFLEPPSADGERGVTVVPVAPNISVIRYVPFFPYVLKFRSRPLFNLLMRRQARLIAGAIGKPIDLVWDFDNAYQFTDLSVFGARRSAFHLMDAAIAGMRGDKNSDLVLAVSPLLLDAVKPLRAPAHVVTHGLGRAYADHAARTLARSSATTTAAFRRVGYVGNLHSGAADREAIARLVQTFPELEFHFIGPAEVKPGTPKALADWLDAMASCENCVLHGRQEASYIIEMSATIDAWLACYSLSADANQAADSHKILEYLAMGGPVLTSWLARYENSPLVAMAERGSNEGLVDLLGDLVRNPTARSKAARDTRMAYALSHSYDAKITAIGDLLDTMVSTTMDSTT